MSGGSYDYLCFTSDLDELLNKAGSLEEMADRLAGLGFAQDAARETQELLVLLRQWQVRAEVRARRLGPVWKAVEWMDSGDSSVTDVHEALTEYRGEDEQR